MSSSFDYRIAPLDGALLPQALSLTDAVLGSGYLDPTAFVKSPGAPVRLAAVATDGMLSGLLLGYVLGPGRARDTLLEGHDLVIDSDALWRADKAGSIGVLKTIAVRPQVQGRGVGRNLLAAGEALLKALGATLYAMPAWMRGDEQVSIGRLAEKAGYSVAITVPGFWAENCEAGLITCPERGDSEECICAMRLYLRPL
jgi:GNAT superfamily N-acetyltransferase